MLAPVGATRRVVSPRIPRVLVYLSFVHGAVFRRNTSISKLLLQLQGCADPATMQRNGRPRGISGSRTEGYMRFFNTCIRPGKTTAMFLPIVVLMWADLAYSAAGPSSRGTYIIARENPVISDWAAEGIQKSAKGGRVQA